MKQLALFLTHCSVEGCAQVKLYARKMCKKHYKAVYEASPEGKAAQVAYYASPEGKAKRATYRTSPEGKAKRTVREVSPKGQICAGKKGAKRRHLEWGLTFEEYVAVRVGNCVYCQLPLDPTGCGLDRLDNSKGYIPNNVVPCCGDCNMTRGTRYTHEEMLELGPHLRRLKLRRIIGLVPEPEPVWQEMNV